MSDATSKDTEALLKRELNLYRASDIGGVCTIRMDEQLTLIYANDLYFRTHGYQPEELLGKSCSIFIHPLDLPQVHAALDLARRTDAKKANWQMRIITGKKEIKEMMVSGSLGVLNGEEVFDGSVTDISNQKQIGKKLRDSEEKYQIAAENVEISFWTYYFARRQIVQTSRCESRYGFDSVLDNVPEGLMETGYIRQDSAAAFLEMYRKLEQGAKKASGDFWFHHPEKDQWWCEHIDYTNVFDENGRPFCAYAAGWDVTSAKLAERKYQEEVAYSNATQSDSLMVKMRCNVTQNLIESYTAKENFGLCSAGVSYTLWVEELVKTGFTPQEQEMLRERFNRECVLRAFEQSDDTCNMDYRRILSNGRMVWVNTKVKCYQNPETGDVMCFIYTSDIDDAKIKDSILNMVAATDYDYITYVDLKSDTFKMYRSGKEYVEMLKLQQEPYSVAVSKANREIVIPADVERAICEMMPDGIRERLKDRRVFSSVYGVYDKDGSVRQKKVQFTYLDKASEQVLLTRTDITALLDQQKRQLSLIHI